jgi:hypothetical protein
MGGGGRSAMTFPIFYSSLYPNRDKLGVPDYFNGKASLSWVLGSLPVFEG